MGEYAKFGGDEIKIGTCENMYYLRADQALRVTPVPNSLNPVAQAANIRFRFPFPDEDHVQPGAFDNFDRGLAVDVPCGSHETFDRELCLGGTVEIVQQRLIGSALVLVCRCSTCRTRYRLETFDDEARAIVDALVRRAEREHAVAPLIVASRIVDGYEGRHVFGPMRTTRSS